MRYTGLSRQTLHNYTMLGLIREKERTESGHRLYGAEVFKKLGRIMELKKADKTLRDIQEIMSKKAAFS
jgi:DNA-binding transcriptional MerR regulator